MLLHLRNSPLSQTPPKLSIPNLLAKEIRETAPDGADSPTKKSKLFIWSLDNKETDFKNQISIFK